MIRNLRFWPMAALAGLLIAAPSLAKPAAHAKRPGPADSRAHGSSGKAAEAPAKAAQLTLGRGSDVVLPFKEHTLGNGLRILTLEDHSVPSITYWTWFHVGSINERPGITGISHLFEHLMFRGAKKYGPGEFDKALESNGGYSNAFTDKDVTAYFENLISEKLELAVDLDSDRMASLNVTQEVLDPE